MKTATELREIVTQREAEVAAMCASKLKDYVENDLAVRMEKAAKEGEKCLPVGRSELNGRGVEVNALLAYLHDFGFDAHVAGFGVVVKW